MNIVTSRIIFIHLTDTNNGAHSDAMEVAHDGLDDQNDTETAAQMPYGMDDMAEVEREENRILTEMMADFLCDLDDLSSE